MINTFQAFRWIAIFSIFLSHLSFLTGTKYNNIFMKFINKGNFGVTFFFLLSGVVIGYKYKGVIKTDKFDYAIKFTIDKIKRFYPLHLATTICFIPNYFISYFANPIIEIPLLLLNIFLIKSYIPWDVAYFSYNAPTWFLSTLLIVYFTYPFLIQVYYNISQQKYRITKLLLACTVIHLVALLLIILNKYDNQIAKWFFYISPIFRCFDFSIGILVGLIIQNIRKNSKCKCINLKYTVLEISSIFIFAIFYFNRENVDKYYIYGQYWITPLVLILIVFSYENGYISKVLSNKIFIFLGNLSFEFFLVHNVILHFLIRMIGYKFPIITSILGLMISIIFAYLIKNKNFNEKFYSLFKRVGERYEKKDFICNK